MTCPRSLKEQAGGPEPHVLPCPPPHSVATALAMELPGGAEKGSGWLRPHSSLGVERGLDPRDPERGGLCFLPQPQMFPGKQAGQSVRGFGTVEGLGKRGNKAWLSVAGDPGTQDGGMRVGVRRTGRTWCLRLGGRGR